MHYSQKGPLYGTGHKKLFSNKGLFILNKDIELYSTPQLYRSKEIKCHYVVHSMKDIDIFYDIIWLFSTNILLYHYLSYKAGVF